MLLHKADTAKECHFCESGASFATCPPKPLDSLQLARIPHSSPRHTGLFSTWSPAHDYTWDGCQLHSVDVSNLSHVLNVYLLYQRHHSSSLVNLCIGFLFSQYICSVLCIGIFLAGGMFLSVHVSRSYVALGHRLRIFFSSSNPRPTLASAILRPLSFLLFSSDRQTDRNN